MVNSLKKNIEKFERLVSRLFEIIWNYPVENRTSMFVEIEFDVNKQVQYNLVKYNIL